MAILFRYPEGLGAIVLSGGVDAGGEIRAQALRRAYIEGEIVYIGLDEDAIDMAIDDMEDLGAPSGYFVDIVNDSPESIRKQISTASLIVLVAGGKISDLRNRLVGAVADGMLTAFARGAIILAEGQSAILFGKYALTEGGRLIDGLNWLEDGIVIPFQGTPTVLDTAANLLIQYPSAFILGIGLGSAFSLNPTGVEAWGGDQRQIIVRLGSELADSFQDNG